MTVSSPPRRMLMEAGCKHKRKQEPNLKPTCRTKTKTTSGFHAIIGLVQNLQRWTIQISLAIFKLYIHAAIAA